MKIFNFIKLLSFTLILVTTSSVFAQLPDGFDIKKARLDATNKGIPSTDIEGYVQSLHNDYLYHKNGASHTHNKQGNGGINTIQNTYCPNAGFEQLNFSNWTGSWGVSVTGGAGAAFPLYTPTAPVMLSPSGNNASLNDVANYHTIMTTPPISNVYPNCVGYDSIACKVIGTQTISEIPFLPPNGGVASLRLNGCNALNRACNAKYSLALNPNNKNFSVSYALVYQNGGHAPEDQNYFSVRITDQNGNPVPGCSVYTVTCDANLTNTASPMYDPTWSDGVIGYGIMYRKWQTAAFDFSNYPLITSVNIELYNGSCTQGGHYTYAYVSAQCSSGGALTSFCAGSNTAVLTAPVGYTTYQWVGSSGAVSAAFGGNTGTATITPAVAGQVFTCNVTAPNGCLSTFQTTVSITTVSITGVGSTPSCLGGNSGTANVTATGSSGGYTYQWLNSLGATVGNSQTATGLSPGTYSIIVSTPLCGLATQTVTVGISPPSFYSLGAPFCGTVAWINKPGGSNYKWYTATPLALIAGATSSSLTVVSPVAGTEYFVVYTTPSGCKDSVKLILTQTPGGSIYVSNIKSICSGNSNSYAVVNLQTTAPPVYSYSVTGPSAYSSIMTNTTAIKDSVVGLSIGIYTVVAFDGQCLYNTTFTVAPFIYTYTLTPQNGTVCTSGATTLTANFGNTTPSSCGLSSTGGCSTPNQVTVGTGATLNSSYSYPSVYGHYYHNARHQMLYTAAELSAAGVLPGKISSISFMVNSIPAGYIGTIPGVNISLKCVPLTTIGSTFDNVGLVSVFGPTNVTPVVGWNAHAFTTAYEWDGLSSILVDVCYQWTAAAYTQNVLMPSTTTPVARCIYDRDDSNPLCLSSSSFPTTTTERPNTKFDNCGGSNPALFNYTWTPGATLSSTTSYTTIANPLATTIYSVQVNPIGQINCMQAQTATLVVVNPVPAIITPVSTMCSNAAALTLTVTPTGGVWSGTGVSPTGVLTPSLLATGTNTYMYVAGSGICSSTGTSTITVEKFVPSTITGAIVPLCITNSTINLATALSTSTLGVGVWSGNGVTGTTFNPVTAGTGTTVLTYNTNSLPTTTLCPSTSNIAVSVSSVVQPIISAAGPYCDNFAPQTMTVAPVVVGGTWTSTTSPTAISTTGQFNPALATIGNSTISYSVVSGPCTASTSIAVNVVHFIPATITGGMGPYCIYNPTVNLQAVAQFTGGVWSGLGVSGSDFSPTLAGAGTQTVVYSTDPAPSGLCPDSKTLTILINPKPQANALSNVLKGCNPLQVNLFTSTVNTGSATWNFGDGTLPGTGLSTNHIYTTPGVYTAIISYTDAIGCTNDSAVVNSFTVFPNPIASFAPSVLETTVVDGQIDFTNQSTILNNNSYIWNIGGLATTTQTNTSYLFTNSGTYVITLTALSPDNCSDDTSIVVVVKPDVVLYVPNAFTPGNGDGLNDQFQIFLPPTGVDYSTFNLQIFDRWGEMVYTTVDVNKSWTGAKNNAGPLLKQDVYVWKITFQDEFKKHYEKLGHISLLSK